MRPILDLKIPLMPVLSWVATHKFKETEVYYNKKRGSVEGGKFARCKGNYSLVISRRSKISTTRIRATYKARS